MYICFGEELVFDFGFEAEQSRHDIRALDVDYKSDLSLMVTDEYTCKSFPRSEVMGHVPFSLV